MFVASNPSTDNVRDILDGVVRVTGLEGWDARKPRDGESLSRLRSLQIAASAADNRWGESVGYASATEAESRTCGHGMGAETDWRVGRY